MRNFFYEMFSSVGRLFSATTSTAETSHIIVEAMPCATSTTPSIPDLTGYIITHSANANNIPNENEVILQATELPSLLCHPFAVKHEPAIVENANKTLVNMHDLGASQNAIQKMKNNISLINMAGYLSAILCNDPEKDMASQAFCETFSTQHTSIKGVIKYDCSKVSGEDLKAGLSLFKELAVVNRILGGNSDDFLSDDDCYNPEDQDIRYEAIETALNHSMCLLHGVFDEANHGNY